MALMIISRSRPLRSVVSTDKASPDRLNIQVRFWPVLTECRRILAACNNTTYSNELDCHAIRALTANSSWVSKRPEFTVDPYARPMHRRKRTCLFIRARQLLARQDIGLACDVARSARQARLPGLEHRQRCGAGCGSYPKEPWTTDRLNSWRPDLE